MANSKNTTHCIYRIVCFKTGKVYVGQTREYKRRSNAHFNNLRKNKHHSAKLQNAFNKYGEKSFFIERIENDIPRETIDEREEYWIAHFNSFYDGYNMTPNASIPSCKGRPIPCIWNSVSYESIDKAAQALGVNKSTMHNRVAKGYTSDNDMESYFRPCVWNGKEYLSITEAAKENSLTPAALMYRLNHDIKSDLDLVDQSKPCVWNRISYPSINEAARATGISEFTLRKRIRSGYTCDSDMPPAYSHNVKTCLWDGVVYRSVREAALATGISESALYQRIKKGFTSLSDMQKPRFEVKNHE